MARPPLLAQALVEFDGAQASLAFDGFTKFGAHDTSYLTGTKGSLRSVGPDVNKQTVTLHTARGMATPALRGTWFTSGFHGTMAELLCAIEEKRNPHNSAESSLSGLALCFAAVASAETGRPQTSGKVRRLPRAAI
jgi:predicted dehydrogenase